MALLKKKPQEVSDSKPSANKNLPTYHYHNVRRAQNIGLSRDIKQVSANQIHKAKKLWLEKFGLIILAVAIFASLVSILYLSSSSEVILQHDASKDPVYSTYKASVAATATKLLSSSILNANKITVNTKKIQSTLESDYPMYSSVTITLPLIDHHMVIYLRPAQPAIVLTDTNGQYLLNQAGIVMELSSKTGSFNYLKLPEVSYSIGEHFNIGQQELTTQEVQFIQTVEFELAARNNKVVNMNLPQGSAELNVYVSGKPYYIKFNLQNNDPRRQAGSYLATEHYLQTQNVTPSQYIDVRTDGRVFYK